ncbi:MAG: phosphomannomutase/phosphoglucomutase [Gammaproteobacteria bacterium]|nr:phosphomannomutase/phosphoglucomutase [Gammaproteobacteria bacterium]
MKLGLKLSKQDKKNKKIARGGIKAKAATTSLESSFFILFISATLLIFTGAAVVYQQLQGSMTDSLRSNQSSLITSYSQQLEQSMHHYIAVMDLSVKEPDLVNSIRQNDELAINKRESLLAYMFPSALRIKILDPNFDEPDNSMNPPISYACLDLIRKSRTGSKPGVEAHLLGKPHQHIDIARSIKDHNGDSIGTLLVTLPIQAIKQTLNKINIDSGLLELQQKAKGKTLVISRRGNTSSKQGEAPIIVPVKNTLWQLSFWPGNSSISIVGSSTMLFWGIVGIIWVIFSLLLFIQYRRVSKALLNDQVMTIKIVRDIQYGEISPSYPIALKNCLGTMEQLRMIAGDMTGLRSKNKKNDAGKTKQPVKKDPENEMSDWDLTNNTDALEVHEISEFEATNISNGRSTNIPSSIFRAYDIRGISNKTLTPDVVQKIGHALGSEAQERGQQKIIVARDGRLSGPELSQALINGLMQAGREVVDIGRVPTPVLYFASHYMGNGSGVMLTGSHNPPEYNGLKMMLQGETLHDKSITQIKTRIDSNKLINGEGSVQTIDVVPSYIERITSDVRLEKPLKIIVDCGNGVAGELAPQLYRALGCEVIEMFCEVDGNFPNHHPDPSKPENLIPLTRAVTEQGADLGLAFDGDGDRLGVIDSTGKIIWPDRYLMLLAIDVLTRQPGAQIIYDVKCSSHLEKIISDNGGQPLMWKTGHSYIKTKMIETGAQLAGEMSGHIFFKERWMGFDDALYAGARLLEILASEGKSSSKVFATLPESVSTPELNIAMKEGENFALIEKFKSAANFPGAKLITIDGLRIEFEDGWGLVRASNTTPSIVIRFEANDAAALGRIQDNIRTQLLAINPGLDLPF